MTVLRPKAGAFTDAVMWGRKSAFATQTLAWNSSIVAAALLQIFIFLQRDGDQVLKLQIFQQLPPGHIGHGGPSAPASAMRNRSSVSPGGRS